MIFEYDIFQNSSKKNMVKYENVKYMKYYLRDNDTNQYYVSFLWIRVAHGLSSCFFHFVGRRIKIYTFPFDKRCFLLLFLNWLQHFPFFLFEHFLVLKIFIFVGLRHFFFYQKYVILLIFHSIYIGKVQKTY